VGKAGSTKGKSDGARKRNANSWKKKNPDWNGEYMSYDDFKNWLADVNCTTSSKFREIGQAKQRPVNISCDPEKYYAEWEGWKKACALAKAKAVSEGLPLAKRLKTT
jgi:hypothetical protein